jgi:hypothetical protein
MPPAAHPPDEYRNIVDAKRWPLGQKARSGER